MRRTKQRGTLSAPAATALSRLSAAGRSVFTLEEFAGQMGWPTVRASKLLHQLVNTGWVARIAQAKYLIVPLEAGPESSWSEDSLVIAGHLITRSAVAYWSACHYWNWTEQVPQTVFVQTTRRTRHGRQRVLGVEYRFVRVQPGKFFGLAERTSASGSRFTVTDREKTLVDALDHPELCGGIRQVAEMLHAIEQINWDRLEEYLGRMESGAVYKRLGLLVESSGKRIQMPDREQRIESWHSRLTGGYAPLEPGGPPTGPVNSRWRIRLNVSGVDSTEGAR